MNAPVADVTSWAMKLAQDCADAIAGFDRPASLRWRNESDLRCCMQSFEAVGAELCAHLCSTPPAYFWARDKAGRELRACVVSAWQAYVQLCSSEFQISTTNEVTK